MAKTTNKVGFIQCEYSQYSAAGFTPNANTLYFCTDTQEFYLGTRRFGYGLIEITGSGASGAVLQTDTAVKSITFDGGLLSIELCEPELSDASEAAVYAILKAAESNTIAVTETRDASDKVTGSVLSLKKDTAGSNVTFSESASGLAINAAVGSLDTTNNKIIKLTGDVLGEYALSFAIVDGETGTADEGKKFLCLLGGANGTTEIARIDAANFLKDGMLDTVTLVDGTGADAGKKFLQFVFNTDSGKSTINLDVSDLIDIYSGDNTTIVENNGVFSMKTVGQAGSTSDTAQSPAFGGTFTIPVITYDAYGRVTGTSTANVTLPAAPTPVTGSVGAAPSVSAATKLVAYANLTSSTFSGNDVDVVTSLSSSNTDLEIPTAKAVYDSLCWETL